MTTMGEGLQRKREMITADVSNGYSLQNIASKVYSAAIRRSGRPWAAGSSTMETYQRQFKYKTH
jgi:N-methylhydantoinase B/oxoprolinase/acetone carboxylase alpha subunit